ncbi:MAG: hypothetical protein PHD13_07520 [Methanocellales archaeon]|nr:hypothetical protein [Methanocellales archaeon]MDD3292419.1 hypothetical protein [Methanocellales archaeon]MDD5236005.1 hypothetical protein [Methanocellales archaeon]MDD5485889.1 hypothetical protein [Methanocellales archaeon]
METGVTTTLYPDGDVIVVDSKNPDEPYTYSWKWYRQDVLYHKDVYHILENDEPIVQLSLYSDNTCLVEEMQLISKGGVLAIAGTWSYSPIPTPPPITT